MRRLQAFHPSPLFLAAAAFPALAQDTDLTPAQILDRMDDAINGPKDQSYTVHLVLIDKDGSQKTREMVMLQKGRDKRLVRFIAPADQRGIAFLSLPGDLQYLYLPAFNKVRRIASSVKNTNFAGTDFTYEDLEAVKWSTQAGRRSSRAGTRTTTVLELTRSPAAPRTTPGSWSPSAMTTSIPSASSTTTGQATFPRSSSAARSEAGEGYWVSMDSTMEDVRKQHTTQMLVSDLTLDTGIGDEKFTERYLSQ